MQVAAAEEEKAQRGRKIGWRCTSKAEDKKIITKFHKLRPPGHGIDSNVLHRALPKKLKKKLCRRTVIRRLAEKNLRAQKKMRKTDYSEHQRRKRVEFCRNHEGKTLQEWKETLQAVGDIKEFTYYPQALQPRFMRLRAPWTHMTNAEKQSTPFFRPRR